MVTAGEGASAPTSSTYGSGGGGAVGGKMTRPQFRKSRTTPYDRPATALRNPSLLSKLVMDPLKNLASSAAHRLFASVSGQRLMPPPPPPLPPESNKENGDGPGEAVLKNQAETPAPLAVDCQNLTSADIGGISELEQLLRQKTFTRSEIDHLTALLRSKAVDLPVDSEVKWTEASLSESAVNFEKQQQLLKSPLAENGIEKEKSRGVISSPGVSAKVLQEDVASPAELAKAYMGSRPSKVSPSMLGWRSQAIREEAALLSNVPFTPKSHLMSLAPKTSAHVELAESSFTTTPRPRGRSAIYNMARTPYSRVHPTAFGKASGPRRYGFDGYLLPSSTLQEENGELGSNKLSQKRRSSVLDDDLGSVGPIRRIRQKHNLSSQKLNLPTTCGIGRVSDTVQQPLSLTQKLPYVDEWKYKGLKMVGENEDNGSASTSYAHVPPKSSEMAARILQHLEKMTPKEKSAESKLVIAREKSPAKLTTDMLHGQALRSLEDANSPRLLWSTQGGQSLEDLSQSSLAGFHDFTSRKQERMEENGPKKLSFQLEISTPLADNNSMASVKDIVPSAEGSDSEAKHVVQHSQKKRGFMMSAHEDSLDLDEDTYCNGPTSDALVGGRGKPEASVTDHSSTSEKVVEDKTPFLPEIKKIPPEPIFGKQTDLETCSATVLGGEKIGVAFPALHTSSLTSPSVMHPLSTSEFEKPKQAIDKIPAIENSSISSATDLLAPKPSSLVQPKPESLSSSGMAVLPVEVPGSDRHGDNRAQETADAKGKPETLRASPFSSPSVSIFSSVVPENSNLKNGPLAINPSAVSSTPALASAGFANQTTTAGTSPFSSSSNVTNFATSTWSSATSTGSPFGSAGAPTFQFGSSANPSTAISSVSTTSNAEPSVVNTNTEKEANTGSFNNTAFVGTSFAVASTGSSIFGLSSSSASSTAKSQSDSTAGGSMFALQSSDVGSGVATVSQNLPFQFGSSASSSIFGTSGVSSFTSSSPLFSPSAPATKIFSSGTSFGLSSSTSSLETKSVDSGSGPSSGMFSFGTGVSAASSGANAFSLSSGTPTTFNFGMSSSATSSVTNTGGSSSGTTPSIFSFASSSSSGASMISSSAGTSTGIFGASVQSPFSETNAASSSSATSVTFGSSWQAPTSSPFGVTSSASPSTVFSYGGSPSSFSAANTAPMVFGSSTAASSGPIFSFTTATATNSLSPSPFTTPPMFGNSTSTFTAPGNNDQMSMEDSMAEDVQTTLAVPVFGQQPISPSPAGFAFGSTAVPQSASSFQFGGQQSQGTLQNSSPFQASGSLEFNAGGSFSLGSVGEKSGRRIVKVNRTKHRKK